jgi:AbrB family looped-hinge helix DNA binding protein
MYDSMTSGGQPVPPPKVSRVQGKGQVTIPTDIRKKLGLKKCDLVAFVETEDGVLLSPREVVVAKALEKIGKALQDKGITLEQLLEDGHALRGRLLEEHYGLRPDNDTRLP